MRAAILLLAFGTLATTVLQAQTPPPARQVPSPSPGRQCICTMEYDPVCARTRDGAEMTFSNPCRAGCVGAVVLRKGSC